MGEQPNAWELLHPRAKVSRHRTYSIITNSVDYIFIRMQSAKLHWRWRVNYFGTSLLKKVKIILSFHFFKDKSLRAKPF